VAAVILYLWTAPGHDPQRGHSGVSGDQAGAQLAAEACLRTGQARLAYIEVAHTAIAPRTLNPCYMRTGVGWWAWPNVSGDISWMPFPVYGTLGTPGRPPMPSERLRRAAAPGGTALW